MKEPLIPVSAGGHIHQNGDLPLCRRKRELVRSPLNQLLRGEALAPLHRLQIGQLQQAAHHNLEGESYSIGNQKKLLTKVAKEKGYTNLVHFLDDGISGVTMDRPGFNDMMEQLAAGKAAAVFVKDLSRLGRNYIEVGKLMEDFSRSMTSALSPSLTTSTRTRVKMSLLRSKTYLTNGTAVTSARSAASAIKSRATRGNRWASPPMVPERPG